MLISFDVDSADLETIRLAHMRYCVSDEDPVEIGGLLRAAASEIDALTTAMRGIVAAVDSDPDAGPFQRTTLTLVRGVAAKALNEGRE